MTHCNPGIEVLFARYGLEVLDVMSSSIKQPDAIPGLQHAANERPGVSKAFKGRLQNKGHAYSYVYDLRGMESRRK